MNIAIAGIAIVVLNVIHRRATARRAMLLHMQEEIAHMKPIFDALYVELLERFNAGDYPGFEDARRRLAVMTHRWKREVTDKLKR